MIRQRVSRPFGWASPALTERDAVARLTGLVEETVTARYEAGWAIRVRGCEGRFALAMLDGSGCGGGLGTSPCGGAPLTTGNSGAGDIWWSQRSGGRVTRLLWDVSPSASFSGSSISSTSLDTGTGVTGGVARTGAIGGEITVGGVGLAGVTVTACGYSATTGSDGRYSITGIPVGSTCTVTPTLTGYTFSPSSDSATVTIGGGMGKDFTATAMGTLVMVGGPASSSDDTLARSTDGGANWTGLGKTLFSTYGNCVYWNDRLNLLIAGGQGTNHIGWSEDGGENWTGCGLVLGSALDGVTNIYDDGVTLVAAGTYKVAYSTDGKNWTLDSLPLPWPGVGNGLGCVVKFAGTWLVAASWDVGKGGWLYGSPGAWTWTGEDSCVGPDGNIRPALSASGADVGAGVMAFLSMDPVTTYGMVTVVTGFSAGSFSGITKVTAVLNETTALLNSLRFDSGDSQFVACGPGTGANAQIGHSANGTAWSDDSASVGVPSVWDVCRRGAGAYTACGQGSPVAAIGTSLSSWSSITTAPDMANAVMLAFKAP